MSCELTCGTAPICKTCVTWPNHRKKSKKKSLSTEMSICAVSSSTVIRRSLQMIAAVVLFTTQVLIGDAFSTLLECFITLVESYRVHNFFTIHRS